MMKHLWVWTVFHVVFTLNEEQKKFIVEKHNSYRSQVDPPASDMMALRWNKPLEDLAASYAAKCIWEHNENRGATGENMFLMTGTEMDVQLGLQDWHNEWKYYNFSSSECEAGKMCGHYTQIIWSSSAKIGCGSHFCEKIEGYDLSNAFILVCNYEPPGNFHGMKPYKVGSPCADCPAESVCNGSLCEKDAEEISPSPDIIKTESQSYLSTEPNVRITGMTTEPTEIGSPEIMGSFGPILTLLPANDVPDLTSKMVDNLVVTTEDASLTHIVKGTNPTNLLETDITTQRDEDTSLTQAGSFQGSTQALKDAQLTQSTADTKILQATNGDNNMVNEWSSTQLITNSPLSFQSLGTDSTVSPLIVTKNEKVNTSPYPTYPPSSQDWSTLLHQLSTNSPSSKQDIYTKKELSTETAPADKSPQTSSAGTKTTLSSGPTVSSSTTLSTAIPSNQHSPKSHRATTSTTKLKPTPVSEKALKDQKQKDTPVKDLPYPKHMSKVNKDKAKTQQSTNSASYNKKYSLKTGIATQSQKWDILSKSSGQTFFGKPVFRAHIYKQHVPGAHYSLQTPPDCPYPCTQQSSKFTLVAPLYRKKSHFAQQNEWWSASKPSHKPSSKRPCKPFGYKTGIYSLYLPQSGQFSKHEQNLIAKDKALKG